MGLLTTPRTWRRLNRLCITPDVAEHDLRIWRLVGCRPLQIPQTTDFDPPTENHKRHISLSQQSTSFLSSSLSSMRSNGRLSIEQELKSTQTTDRHQSPSIAINRHLMTLMTLIKEVIHGWAASRAIGVGRTERCSVDSDTEDKAS